MPLIVVEATALTRRDGVRRRYPGVARHHGPAEPLRPYATGLPQVRAPVIDGATVQGARAGASSHIPSVTNIGIEPDKVGLGSGHPLLVVLVAEGLGVHVP